MFEKFRERWRRNPSSVKEPSKRDPFIAYEDGLTKLAERPTDPEIVTTAFQGIWSGREAMLKGEGVKLPITVSECTYTTEELIRLKEQKRRVGYLPEGLSTAEQRHLLVKLWPDLAGVHLESIPSKEPIKNHVDWSGWFDYDASPDAPYLGTTKAELEAAIAHEGRAAINLSQYIVATMDSFEITYEHLDEGTMARLVRVDASGDILVAQYMAHKGSLWLSVFCQPDETYEDLGGRSVGFPAAEYDNFTLTKTPSNTLQ